MAGRVACIGENFIQNFDGIPGRREGNEVVERPRRRWQDNIKTSVKGIRRGVDWVRMVRNG